MPSYGAATSSPWPGRSLTERAFPRHAMESIARLLGGGQARPAPERHVGCGSSADAAQPRRLPARLALAAPMNYVHAPCIKAGKVRNRDVLDVLYTAMVEPMRFMRMRVGPWRRPQGMI